MSKLVNGFRFGFDIGYQGLKLRHSESRNLPFTVGNQTVLWNKLMKETRLGRVAGLYDQIPYDNYIQSPISLVPKDNGLQTHLIFHLSFDFKDGKSLNHHTPENLCSVKYRDLDEVVRSCLYHARQGANPLWFGKSDARSAFRVLPLLPVCWKWLIMKAHDPRTGRMKYFVDKCLPFSASISCALFQEVSDAIRHILEHRTAHKIPDKRSINNYLDNFLFIARTMFLCNWLIHQFLDLCNEIGMPINMDKTEWASQLIVFLGILLNGNTLTISVPEQKRDKALLMLRTILTQKKAKISQLQELCGFLNFLCKAVFAGRAFL